MLESQVVIDNILKKPDFKADELLDLEEELLQELRF